MRRAAKMLQVQLEFIEVRSGDDLKSAFQTAKHKKVGAAFLVFSPLYVHASRGPGRSPRARDQIADCLCIRGREKIR